MIKKHFFKILWLTLLAVAFYACQHDIHEVEVPETNRFGIVEARNWFETNVLPAISNEILLRNADDSDELITLTPVLNWNIAEMSRDPNWEVVELPWEYKEVVEIFALGSVWQHALANGTIPQNVIRLVVMQNRETGETYGFRMKVAPTLDYLQRNAGSLDSNKYLDRSSNLSGLVMFYTLRGQFLNGWWYQDGEIITEIIGKREVSNDEDTNVLSTRSSDKDGGVLDEVVVIGNSPHWNSTMTNIFQQVNNLHPRCPFDGGDNSSGNGGSSGGADTQAPTVDINGSSVVEMGQMASFSVNPSNITTPVSRVVFEIRRRNGSFRDMQISTSYNFSMRMPNPAHWEVRARVILSDFRELSTPVHRIEVQFPDISTIQNNATISTAMRNVWQQTKNAASLSGRREFGFWIYADTRNGALTFVQGAVTEGAFVSGCAGTAASISQGPVTEIQIDPHCARTGGRFTVAHFHTHTPLTFCPSTVARTVGPTPNIDVPWANSRGMPGLVYDYTGSFVSQQIGVGIIGGHNINASATVYTFGPHRRMTPTP